MAADFLGSDFDYITAPDDDFSAEPDFKFIDVPLSYTDNYSSTVEKFSLLVNGALNKEIISASVDRWGTIATPEGTYNCLRINYTVNAINTLAKPTDVKLNNNNKAVTINNDDDDLSAILDVKSNNK